MTSFDNVTKKLALFCNHVFKKEKMLNRKSDRKKKLFKAYFKAYCLKGSSTKHVVKVQAQKIITA